MFYMKWERRNGKWEIRSWKREIRYEKWEIMNLEVGGGIALNWAPKMGSGIQMRILMTEV